MLRYMNDGREGAFDQVYGELKQKQVGVKRSFQILDRDHDECLSKEDFRLLLENNDIQLSPQSFEQFFSMNARNGKVSYSNLYAMVNRALQNRSPSNNTLNSSGVFNTEEESSRTMLRLGEIESRSNPYLNPYNHSRPQNISRIDQSFTEDYQPFTTTVFRTGHYSKPLAKSEDQPSELSSLTRDLLNYDFRPNVEFIHKHILVSSPIPIRDDIIHGVVSTIQQQLSHIAVLRHFTFYRVTDTTDDNKCVLSFVWCPIITDQNLSHMVEQSFGKDVWKRMCVQLFTAYQIQCDSMVDIHPNYSNDKFLVYSCV